jgi:hypothetical protein
MKLATSLKAGRVVAENGSALKDLGERTTMQQKKLQDAQSQSR